MLKKLIKHEFRATSRILWPVFAAMLLLSALTRVSFALLERDNHWLIDLISALILICFVFALVALMFTPLVLASVRWHNHVLRDEGYLTLTLPISIHQLLFSKLIVSAVWSAATFLMALLVLLLAVGGWSDLQYVPGFFGELFSAFFALDGATRAHLLLIGLELLLNFVFILSAASLMIYAAYSIGFAAKSHKTLFTSLLVFVFVLLAQYVAIGIIGGFINAAPRFWQQLTHDDVTQALELFFLCGILGELLFAAAGYALTCFFTTKKLNLD